MLLPFVAKRIARFSLMLLVIAPHPLLSADQGNTLRSLSSIAMSHPLHFTTPDGNAIVVPVGTYALHRSTDTRLRLIASDNQSGFDVQAVTVRHAELIDEPVALTVTGAGNDDVHIVLLFPEGDGLDAIGSMTGVKARAPSAATATSTQISQAIAKTSPSPLTTQGPKVAQIMGGPPSPLLDYPAPNQAISDPVVRFRWHPTPGQPAPTRYELCLAEPGAACTNGSRAFVARTVETASQAGTVQYELGVTLATPGSAASGTPITQPTYQLPVPRRFHGKRVNWSVAACGPDKTTPALLNMPPSERCNYSLSQTLGWVIAAPQLVPANTSVTMGYNPLRPLFAIRNKVSYADTYLFCISRPGLGCPNGPGSSADQLVVQTTALSFAPDQALTQFQGRTMHWTAATCNAAFGCVYQQQYQEIAIPVPGPIPMAPALLAPTSNAWVNATTRTMTFTWSPSPSAVTYTLCVSPPGVACGTPGSYVIPGIPPATNNSPLVITRSLPASLGSTGATVNWTVAACNNLQQCTYQPQVRPLRIRQAVEDTFSVLTYNIYMRPTTLFRNGQSIRTGLLPDQLHGFDVIMFNEAFDDDVRDDLLQRLLAEYPHHTRIVGSDGIVGQDGGVILVSKWPILEETQNTFGTCLINGGKGGSTECLALFIAQSQGAPNLPRVERMCEGSDCQAEKGVLYAKVCKNNRPYHLVATHMQANHEAVHWGIQQNQLRFIRNFINSLSLSSAEPVIIGGDFNIRRDSGNARSSEFGIMQQLLGATYPVNIDSTHPRVLDLPDRCTYCYQLNGLAGDQAEGKVTLDYLVTSQSNLTPKDATIETRRIQSSQRWREYFWESWLWDLSDHYPVNGRFTFEWPDDQRC